MPMGNFNRVSNISHREHVFTQTLRKSRRAVGVSPSVHCLGDHFSDRLLISPKVILRTPRANVGHVMTRLAVWAVLFAGWVASALAAAQVASVAEESVRDWDSRLLQEANAWPHAEKDARIVPTPRGLRVEVVERRTFAIAAASRLTLPADTGIIRVRVAEIGGGARWFVRLYGEMRQPGKHHTTAIAQDETGLGELAFPLDPRLRTLPEAPIQLQLGVEGAPGAWAVFEEVVFLPAPQRANRAPARSSRADRKTSPPWNGCPICRSRSPSWTGARRHGPTTGSCSTSTRAASSCRWSGWTSRGSTSTARPSVCRATSARRTRRRGSKTRRRALPVSAPCSGQRCRESTRAGRNTITWRCARPGSTRRTA